LTICSIIGRFAGGWLIMRLPIRAFAVVNLCVQMTGLLTIGFAASSQMAIIGAAIFGISVGNLLMIQPLWLAEAFPGSVYPRVFALANASAVAGVSMGPFVLGLAYDQANYTVAYAIAMAVSVLALIFIVSAGKRPKPVGELV
jgi:predicted MFS family arabinose efflux permease